jgi:hypothetical protein
MFYQNYCISTFLCLKEKWSKRSKKVLPFTRLCGLWQKAISTSRALFTPDSRKNYPEPRRRAPISLLDFRRVTVKAKI